MKRKFAVPPVHSWYYHSAVITTPVVSFLHCFASMFRRTGARERARAQRTPSLATHTTRRNQLLHCLQRRAPITPAILAFRLHSRRSWSALQGLASLGQHPGGRRLFRWFPRKAPQFFTLLVGGRPLRYCCGSLHCTKESATMSIVKLETVFKRYIIFCILVAPLAGGQACIHQQ